PATNFPARQIPRRSTGASAQTLDSSELLPPTRSGRSPAGEFARDCGAVKSARPMIPAQSGGRRLQNILVPSTDTPMDFSLAPVVWIFRKLFAAKREVLHDRLLEIFDPPAVPCCDRHARQRD